MKVKSAINLTCILGFSFFLFFPGQSLAQDGKVLFRQTCGACHTIGKGRAVGPDLAGVSSRFSEEWLFEWTRSSQSMIQRGDPEAVAIHEKYNGLLMPDQDLSDDELRAIYAYIDSESPEGSGGGSQEDTEPIYNASDDASPEEIERGKKLFIGSQKLTNGGPACIACHNLDYTGVIPGGLLAKDLTQAYSRMGMDAGLKGILGAPPFPAMTRSYENHPITDKEIAALTAFLNVVDRDTANQKPNDNHPLLYGGATGVMLLLVLYAFIWYGRKRYSVNREIYNRQIKSN